MPAFIQPINLLIKKSAVAEKYIGGLDQFRTDFQIGDDSNYNDEDDELFIIAGSNDVNAPLIQLIERGLSFDSDNQTSDDFVVLPRHGKRPWSVSWLEDNTVFAWHKDCAESQKVQANNVADTTLDELEEMFNNDQDPFRIIRSF
jgi:hypothetical protein